MACLCWWLCDPELVGVVWGASLGNNGAGMGCLGVSKNSKLSVSL